MSKSASLPPIEDLIPHRGAMLLLDRVVYFDTENACTEYNPKPDAWYADRDGNMPAWIGIELMAQTVATHAGLLKCAVNAPPKQGVLLGTRRYSAAHPIFLAGKTLSIHSRVILSDPGGLGAYECVIKADGESLATATLKVFEPDDFQSFLQTDPS